MTPRRFCLSPASSAALCALLVSTPLRAVEPVQGARETSPRAVSYWYRIPRRAVEITQGAYSVSADRLQQLTTTTTLERLRDCEARTGLSLMTLWEFRGSTISLQAGRNGEPTLRWSSRVMHRNEATRGLLDALISREPQVELRESTWHVASN